MKRIHTLSVIILSLLLFSCGNKYVLSPEKLADVLVDMHVTEGIAMQQRAEFRNNGEKVDLYNSVFKKHQITPEQFDSTMVYYSKNCHQFVEIYDVVYQRLEDLKQEVEDGNYTLSKGITSAKIYETFIEEDIDVLPRVKGELWNRLRDESFYFDEYDDASKTLDVKIDTLVENKLQFRCQLMCDSIEALKCHFKMVTADGKESVKSFDLPVDSSQFVKLDWEVQKPDAIKEISLSFDVKNEGRKSNFLLRRMRLYELASEERNINIF